MLVTFFTAADSILFISIPLWLKNLLSSTLTKVLITNDKTFKRKLSEIRLALKLEKQLSKNEILEKYLNNIYFGSGIYGIHDACLSFFDKQPNDVNLAESAILAGVVKNPSKV